MRSHFLPAVAAALATAIMAIPAQAQPHWHHRHLAPSLRGAHGAAGPVYRPAPFSNGYYEGTDPDPQVREELMRDPPNDR
jgi:hypothetical protein